MLHVRPGRLLAVLLPLLLLCACAANPGDGSEPRVRRSPDVLTEEEIRASPTTNLGDLIRRERPRWLRMRDPGTIHSPPPPVVVYVDGARFGTHEDLFKIQNGEVVRVRFLDARRAVARHGDEHANGAIEVSTTD